MPGRNVTTPFGRRPMTLALMKHQLDASQRASGKVVEKWKVFREVCEAKDALGLQDRALAVLNALLSFYPETELSDEHRMVVFPSNAQLSLRAHGITGTTLRRHLAALVEAGLIQRHDSPNGKRYAHRNRSGQIEQAYGFSLAPLLARAEELARLAQKVVDDRQRLRRSREALTICRRDVRKLLSAALLEPDCGDWSAFEARCDAILGHLPRNPTQAVVDLLMADMTELREDILNRLDHHVKTQNSDANDSQIERHKQDSESESIHEIEQGLRTGQGEKFESLPRSAVTMNQGPAFPLGMVLSACPDIGMYGPGGRVSNWRELMTAAVVVRSMLGISPDAYEEACAVLGAENAAAVIACILERSGQINCAGGYLRNLTRRTAKGEFSLGPMLMALLRSRAPGERKAG